MIAVFQYNESITMFLKKVLITGLLLFLSGHVYAQAQSSAYIHELEDRIVYTEEQNRHLINKVEELSYTLKQNQQQMATINQTLQAIQTSQNQATKTLGEVNNKVSTGETQSTNNNLKADKTNLANPTPAITDNSTKMLAEGDAQFDYDQAKSTLYRGDYDDAEATFKKFIDRYPSSPLVINARYWLGETYLIQNRYTEASVAFAEVYQSYKHQIEQGASKDHLKQSRAIAPESLIKLAFALKGMKKIDEACATLDQVKTEFSQLSYNLVKLAERARHGLRCRKDS